MTTYYINPDATYNGDGTLPTDAAGAGQAGAFNAVPSISASNTYLFKRDTSISAAQITLNTDVTLGAYYNDDGTDDVARARPIITNSGSGHTLAATVDSHTGIRLRDLDVRGGSQASTRTLYIRPTTITDSIQDMDFEASNCAFSKGNENTIRLLASNVRFYNCEMSGGGAATTDVVYASADNVQLINCHLHTVGTSDILQATPSTSNALIEGWVIRGCSFISSIDNYGCLTFTGPSAVVPSIIEDNVLKYGNIVANLKADNLIFRRNMVVSGANTASVTGRVVGVEADNVALYNNLIVDSNNTAPTAQYGCLWLGACSGVTIYNNTIIGLGVTDAQYDGISIHQTTSYNAVVKNNIIANFYNNLRMRTGNGHIESHNCLYNPVNQNYVSESGTETPTLSVLASPNLNSAYAPSASSPCIGAGLAPLNEMDFDGCHRSTMSSDIGAKWFYRHEDSTVNTLLASGGAL